MRRNIQKCKLSTHPLTSSISTMAKCPSQRRSQTVSCETKDMYLKRSDHRAEVCTINTRFQDLSLYQQDQVGHCQMPMSILTFDRVQSWYNPTATDNRYTQPSTRTMAKCRSQRHSQTVSCGTKDIYRKRSNHIA